MSKQNTSDTGGISFCSIFVLIKYNTMSYKDEVYITNVTKNPQPKPRFRTEREYDFLQYSRVVHKWAMEHYNIKRGSLDLLLYLYPKAVFSKNEFGEYHKTIGLYQQKTFKTMINEGYIKMWRPKSKKECALYHLTEKGKRLCSRMHRMCTGEEEIPTTKSTNKMLSKKDAPRIDQYWLNIMKKSNRDK